ncbi:hypothetical protein ACOMHN_026213 [Nucella lapillus]
MSSFVFESERKSLLDRSQRELNQQHNRPQAIAVSLTRPVRHCSLTQLADFAHVFCTVVWVLVFRTLTSFQTLTSVQTLTSFQTLTSVQTLTSLQTLTSVQTLTSLQTLTSVQTLTSLYIYRFCNSFGNITSEG